MLKHIDNWLEKIEKLALVSLFLALIAAMVINIIQRNVFGQSSQLTQELMPIGVLWISLIGASLALKHGKHISMELVLRFVPPDLKRPLLRLSGVFGAVVMAIGFYLALDFMKGELKIFGTRGYLSIIIPVFFALAFFRYVIQIFYPHANAHGEVHA